MKEKEEKKNKQKLSLKQTIENAGYAMKICMKYNPPIVIHSFFLWLIGHGEWVFFDGVFMRVIVKGLDEGRGFGAISGFIVITMIVIALCSIYSNYVKNVVYPLETNRLFRSIYKLMYKKAKNVELKCYEDSDFYNRYTMAMDGAEEKLVAQIRGIMGTVIGVVAVCIVFKMMFDIDHYSVLFVIFPLIGNFVFGYFLNKYEYKRYQELVPCNKVFNYVSRMMYLPDSAKEIRLSNIFLLMKKQYRNATENNENIAIEYSSKTVAFYFWRNIFTFTLIFEGVLLYATYRNRVSNTVDLSELTIMTSLMVAMAWILIRVFDNVMEVMKNAMFINNLREFLEYKEEIPEDQDGVQPSYDFESLEFRNVSFSYSNDLNENITLNNISFVINKNEKVALVGYNGAGKSTIIKLMIRLYDPTEGMILYNGRNIKEYNLKAYREVFATAFQDFSLFGMSIRDNILMGKHYTDEDIRIKNALERVGILDKIENLKDGINTIMTKEFDNNGAVFSGGESQKIAVARTIAKEAPMKIFDEPSSALDPIAENVLLNNILQEGNNHTLLIISHRLSMVNKCDKVFMLEKGNLVEEGTHEDLLELNGSYAYLYKKQAMNYLVTENSVERYEN